MKNLFLGILFITTCIFFVSCEKTESTIIDKITVVDNKNNIVADYSYDVVNESYIGEAPKDKLLQIKGTLLSKEPNSKGGHNYRCTVSNAICYNKEN